MALASVQDVKRILRMHGDEEPRDSELRAALDAVESWADTHLNYVEDDGLHLETYWDVYEDATLHLPSPDVIVTKVKVFGYPSDEVVSRPESLKVHEGYDVTQNGRLILRPTLIFEPFEGAVASRRLTLYSRVEVYYTGSGVIPRALTEGIAFLAAGYWAHGPAALVGFTSKIASSSSGSGGGITGITSERIGDYSYKFGDGGSSSSRSGSGQGSSSGSSLPYLDQAAFFLQSYMRKSRVAVT